MTKFILILILGTTGCSVALKNINSETYPYGWIEVPFQEESQEMIEMTTNEFLMSQDFFCD